MGLDYYSVLGLTRCVLSAQRMITRMCSSVSKLSYILSFLQVCA